MTADLDLVNMFGNAEWPCIRAALRAHFPRAAAWTEWQHQADSVTTLPTGASFATNWVVEQGDVLGTIQSALVLGQARAAHLGEFLSSSIENKGVCDDWFVDDGQVFVRPFQFDPFLRALDGALATFGATRSCAAHGNDKSSARLLCPPERQHEFQGWDTQYVHDTVDVLVPDAGTTALGSAFGSREHINARAWESVRACSEMRTAIGGVDHAPTEMVLTRQCADVSKLMYHMRINGDLLDTDLLVAFDGQLRASVSASLNGDLPDHSWWQATTGVSCGGMGLRTALGVSHRLVMAEYDARTDAMRDQPTPSLRHAPGITPDDGDGDDEHPLARKRVKVQALITTAVDTCVHSGLLQMHEQEGSWRARARLQELADAEIDHTWMWRLNPHHGAVREPEEYVASASAVPSRANLCPARRVRTGLLTLARLMPPAARWARPRGVTLQSPR